MENIIFYGTGGFVLGYLLDLILGDPNISCHPVRLIGKLISAFEKCLYKAGNSVSQRRRGRVLAAAVICVTFACTEIIRAAAYLIHPVAYMMAEAVLIWFGLAQKSLRKESMKVHDAFEKGDTEAARYAVSMIVGRDTERLDDKGIMRAAVETVAENTSDGVTAPMIYAALFGAAGMYIYKAVNTMDSMVGYKNERYIDFGRCGAKLDDVFNYIPSRLTALLMICAAYFLEYDHKNAYRIFKRDRYKHASPNSAQTESACAGALGLRLAGDAWYGGVLHKKEYIGDAHREIENEDIVRACRLMNVTCAECFILMMIVRCVFFMCI